MKDAGISIRHMFVFIITLPSVTLVSCVALALTLDYEKAIYTHCEVDELLPSISAAIGSFHTLRFIWSITVALITGPRLFIARLNRSYLIDVCSDKPYAVNFVYSLNILEILSLMTLSFIPSSEIFLVHALAFSMFLITFITSMILVTFYLRDTRKRRLKKNILKLALLCIVLAFYFYTRHNQFCEPYVYTLFALCEYTVVICNLIWHASITKSFIGYDILVERRLEINL